MKLLGLGSRPALVALYDATDGPNWVNGEGWLTDGPLGEWHGVTAPEGRVVELGLSAEWDIQDLAWIPHGFDGRDGSLQSPRGAKRVAR